MCHLWISPVYVYHSMRTAGLTGYMCCGKTIGKMCEIRGTLVSKKSANKARLWQMAGLTASPSRGNWGNRKKCVLVTVASVRGGGQNIFNISLTSRNISKGFEKKSTFYFILWNDKKSIKLPVITVLIFFTDQISQYVFFFLIFYLVGRLILMPLHLINNL